MALYDLLVGQIRAHLPGATDASIYSVLWEVINDLCRDAYVWRETISVPLVAGDTDYAVPVTDAEIVQVFSVSHTTMDVSNVVYEFGTLQLLSATPTAADAAEPLYLVAALTPSVAAGDTEAWLPVDLWPLLHRALMAGVLSKAMAQPAKPYSNAQMAAYYGREYRSLKAVEKRRAATGNQQGAQHWTFPPFAVRSLR